ncbi:radical SAM family heme chaperone HemW [Flavobacterium sp. J27]|uniref:radical SAM family heme chaperone HemW n=1 Tax=Flavobacterium sp. J27 TaxID=2060419 RepID=UPI001031FE0E|nr:radical SAM family heme chaperone HemW [Flavobacterium sp. J27]
MSGIYIHIPFCKQACHYCDFHFSTNLKKKEAMILALAEEIKMRKNEFQYDPEFLAVETIYFGGGTPSILTVTDLNFLLDTIYQNYKVVAFPEITVEANPDDLTEEKIIAFSKNGINRLSIGVQSFFEDDLKLMNRAHNATEAEKCLQIATQYFDNISIDLIYGVPGSDNEKWKANIEKAISFGVPHISSYALTVEPKTALDAFVKKGIVKVPDDAIAEAQFHILIQTLEQNGFVHYELSNFGKPNYFSKNNSAYWLGKKYIGIGPSAHSYDGKNRSWNIANNTLYIQSVTDGRLPAEVEVLTQKDRYNEYIMTGLRTIWGVSLERIETEFGTVYVDYLQSQMQRHLQEGLLEIKNDSVLVTTKKGKFLSDGIASDLFLVHLK